MTKSIIGPNAAIRYLKAYNAHLDYWHQVNPAYLLGYVDNKDHAKYIQEYAAAFPDSMVVARIQHPLDGGFHLPPEDKTIGHYVASPQNYHNDFGWLGRISNVILNVFNEPDGKADDATIARLIDWMREYIPIAVQNKTKSVLFNWGKGQPRIFGGMMDARFGDVLNLASLYPELFYMGMHFYGPEDTTESIRAYVALCDSLHITPLKVIGTEWGNDSRVGGGIEAAWEISQIKHDLSEFVKSGVLVGFCRFQDGNSGGWEGYAIENDTPYKDEIKRAAQAGELEPMATKPLQPNYTPDTFTAGMSYKVQTPGAYINLHAAPIVTGNVVGQVDDGSIITVYEEMLVASEYWRRIGFGELNGWISMQGGLVKLGPYVPSVTPPVPVVIPPPVILPDNPSPATPQPTIWARVYAAELAVAQAHLALAQLYRELDSEATGSRAA